MRSTRTLATMTSTAQASGIVFVWQRGEQSPHLVRGQLEPELGGQRGGELLIAQPPVPGLLAGLLHRELPAAQGADRAVVLAYQDALLNERRVRVGCRVVV